MPWFVKTETFLRPYAEVEPHLRAHRLWVEQQRACGVRICSGYRVDGEGRPGGGGLLLLEAENHAAAEELLHGDPMIASGCVAWQLHGWRPVVGDLDLH